VNDELSQIPILLHHLPPGIESVRAKHEIPQISVWDRYTVDPGLDQGFDCAAKAGRKIEKPAIVEPNRAARFREKHRPDHRRAELMRADREHVSLDRNEGSARGEIRRLAPDLGETQSQEICDRRELHAAITAKRKGCKERRRIGADQGTEGLAHMPAEGFAGQHVLPPTAQPEDGQRRREAGPVRRLVHELAQQVAIRVVLRDAGLPVDFQDLLPCQKLEISRGRREAQGLQHGVPVPFPGRGKNVECGADLLS
jgi:hypothetical protein